MATIDVIVVSLIFVAIAIFIYNKFGEPIGRFWEWLKSLMVDKKDRFKSSVKYSKELVYE